MDSNKMNNKRKLNLGNILLFISIAIGLAFAISQFLYNRSLWLDESYLALNIINRGWYDLLQPLDYNQVAPIFYLFIEKLFMVVFGSSEYALRIFSLLAYLTSIYFLFKIFEVLKLNIYVTILSLSLFIFNSTIIYYSSEVKQYTADVLVITCMFYFTLRNQKSVSRKYILLGIFGSISVFLSNVSPIILLCCGIYLLYKDFKNGWKELRNIVKISFVWIAVFGIYFIFFIYDHPTREFMVNYWSYWAGGSFLPLNPLRVEFYLFILIKYESFYNQLFQFGVIGFFGLQLLFFLGSYSLYKKKKYGIFGLGVLPIIIHIGLSSLKLYPFDTRLILYTIPAFIIILAHGFEYIMLSFGERKQKIGRISLVILIFPFLIYSAYAKLPIKCDEPRESFQYVNQKIEKDDMIFASHYSKFPLMYYIQSSLVDFSDNEIFMEDYGYFEIFEDNIVPLKGRVWFVFKDFLEYKKLNYLKEKYNDENHTLLDEYHTQDVTVLLYEIE